MTTPSGPTATPPLPSNREIHPLTLFTHARSQNRPLYISAPMVRYSKLPFRLLLSHYNIDLCFSPMILAHEFIRHARARDSDFATHPSEPPLIVQFASSSPVEFARAALMVKDVANGVDLNCGCPQSWAMGEGVGCALMSDPEVVAGMVRAAKSVLGPEKSVSVKIRIHAEIEETVRFVRLVVEAGVDFVTIHGRLKKQRSSTSPDYEAVRLVKERFPELVVVVNGDVETVGKARDVCALTGCQGVMTARALLVNPALFAGFETTPREAVERFVGYAVATGLKFELVVHHVNEMMGALATRKERRALTEFKDVVDLVDWLDGRWEVKRWDVLKT